MQQAPDSLSISALQHILFCPRQCGLIHIEKIWAENLYTAEGRILHERADEGGLESRGNTKICRSVHICSRKYGIHGIADVVEYTKASETWIPRPVEYKRGKPKKYHEDEVQLCAQALCLEEMHHLHIPNGDLYYGKVRRRKVINFDLELRNLTVATIRELKDMIQRKATPLAEYTPVKCDHCSLIDHCMPQTRRLTKGVQAWNDRCFDKILSDSGI